MENIMADFYTALYGSDLGQTTTVLSPGEDVPPFLTSEVRHAVEAMPGGKTLGADGITVELLQACGPMLYTAPARRSSLYLAKCEVPVAWKQSSPIPSLQKGDKEALENYRLITQLPVLYKVFTRCIMTRIRRTLDEAQPVDLPRILRTANTNVHRLQEGTRFSETSQGLESTGRTGC
ncbi:hypothetical protein ANCCEY_13440 [Ancylostoma ceylanicum]|uniref:Reverse transcriptase domain-containing protein n=2 Tax=Ancylostoma ceylanicum TaxID=53326 RepID=A0A0D6L7J3_9BILA|nr:hypothetical protein ANCCEY_13440 [Ancylostoma ceylanicum]EYB83640.1 hypothetical protein Y032_0332g2778 [Ancylostoma ceylanicum]